MQNFVILYLVVRKVTARLLKVNVIFWLVSLFSSYYVPKKKTVLAENCFELKTFASFLHTASVGNILPRMNVKLGWRLCACYIWRACGCQSLLCVSCPINTTVTHYRISCQQCRCSPVVTNVYTLTYKLTFKKKSLIFKFENRPLENMTLAKNQYKTLIKCPLI